MDVIIEGIKYVPVPELSNDTGLLKALEVRFDSDEGDNLTIRDYLRVLLETLWKEGEGFSGKRPFGKSAWDRDIYVPLIKHGFISGKLDEDGYIDEIDEKEAGEYILELIIVAFHGIKGE